jgi:hypothetical protein
MVEKFCKQIETIEEDGLDRSLLRKKGNSKTFLGWILARKNDYQKEKNFEMAKVMETIYKKGHEFETSEKIRIESWRGKGGIKVWSTPDKIIVEFAGKRDKGEKPNIQRREYTKQEINEMIICINKLKEEHNNKIPSRQLGEAYFKGNWDMKVFSKRTDHHKFTHILNILDYYKIIRYNRAGFTSVLREVKEIQEVLK